MLGNENLFARPVADTFWADEYRASSTVAEGIREAGMKGSSWNEVPPVQPGFQSGSFQLVRNIFDRRLVGAIIGKENIENFHRSDSSNYLRWFPESRK